MKTCTGCDRVIEEGGYRGRDGALCDEPGPYLSMSGMGMMASRGRRQQQGQVLLFSLSSAPPTPGFLSVCQIVHPWLPPPRATPPCGVSLPRAHPCHQPGFHLTPHDLTPCSHSSLPCFRSLCCHIHTQDRGHRAVTPSHKPSSSPLLPLSLFPLSPSHLRVSLSPLPPQTPIETPTGGGGEGGPLCNKRLSVTYGVVYMSQIVGAAVIHNVKAA